MDELVLVKIILAAGLTFALLVAITVMSGGGEPGAARGLVMMLAMGIIVWLVFGVKVFDDALIDALRKYH